MKPLGLTVGDAAGVGPELLLAASRELRAAGPVVVFGAKNILEAALESLRTVYDEPALVRRVAGVRTPAEAADLDPRDLAVIEVDSDTSDALGDAPYPWGRAVPAFGALQHASLLAAIAAASSGEVEAIVTPPWHKARLADAGLPASGHTEVLQDRTHSPSAVMLLAGDVLRVALVTTHLAVRDIAGALTVERIVDVGRVVHAGLRRDFGFASPRVLVCALNPHAGERGTYGDEDDRIVAPAVAALQAEGIDAAGPLPADTLFPLVARGRLRADAVIAMYHDQGLGPLKTLHFDQAANITLGLPFIRTSVDHGTAYDIAGRGVVNPGSFQYAARLAKELAAHRERSG
ncbi:MAG: 4-hydroxythreonine-4-phosphate dehydrogenase PdxA [Myxococcales bacterium]|nr:4-hydroxythreonine-4-phosphate dehydrogenase PdxA [Myxococcales bacterium]MCB9531178.1 4-hydroxythreonine-4-phosphate dehydrogenase PdxA [Myxococcales bacterium]